MVLNHQKAIDAHASMAFLLIHSRVNNKFNRHRDYFVACYILPPLKSRATCNDRGRYHLLCILLPGPFCDVSQMGTLKLLEFFIEFSLPVRKSFLPNHCTNTLQIYISRLTTRGY